MALTWEDAEDIAAELAEAHPDVDPLTVRFTDLHKWVIGLPDFEDDPMASSEGKLERIQMAWVAERESSRRPHGDHAGEPEDRLRAARGDPPGERGAGRARLLGRRDRGARAGAPPVPREDRPGADPQGARPLPAGTARRLRARPPRRADDLPRRDGGRGGADLAQRMHGRACRLLTHWHLRHGAGMARGAAPCHGTFRKDYDRRREAPAGVRHGGRAECPLRAGV